MVFKVSISIVKFQSLITDTLAFSVQILISWDKNSWTLNNFANKIKNICCLSLFVVICHLSLFVVVSFVVVCSCLSLFVVVCRLSFFVVCCLSLFIICRFFSVCPRAGVPGG